MRKKPRYLVCQITVEFPRPWGPDKPAEERTSESWFTLERAEQLDELKTYEQAGFGTDYESVTFEVHEVPRTTMVRAVEIEPRTVKDEALRFRSEGGGVDVGLKGKGRDPKGVFWDSRGNSFAVVTPLDVHERITSEQGVVLVSINGMGEVRWTVYGTCATYAENREAVAHFGLTWRKS